MSPIRSDDPGWFHLIVDHCRTGVPDGRAQKGQCEDSGDQRNHSADDLDVDTALGPVTVCVSTKN